MSGVAVVRGMTRARRGIPRRASPEAEGRSDEGGQEDDDENDREEGVDGVTALGRESWAGI